MSIKLKKQIKALIQNGGSGYDDTELAERVSVLEASIGDESTNDTILARIKALEDAD